MLEIVSEPLTAGTVLADTYRLEHVLGEGGMGVVWAAKDEKTGRNVALKVLADDRATDPTQQARILREASAVMTIDHPNVVKISAVLETDAGVPFIVMERLEGESLRAALVRQGKLEVEATVEILRGIIDAVLAAHTAGIVHRDLKPENVFLVGSGGVKVLDFGIAKRFSRSATESTADASLTETGAVIGTPYYMAPEQVFGDEDVDARADIWSIGVILYECLAGKRPTEADGFGPILKRITSADFDPLPPSVHPRLASVAMRMLARERTARPSLADVRATIANLDEPSPASLARTVETSAPRRRSAFALGFIVIGAAALAVAVRSRMHPAAVAVDAGAGMPTTAVSASKIPAGWDAHAVLMSAQGHQQHREGKECLADLNAFDAMSERPIPKSTDIESGYGGMRGICMMLIGDCEAGKKLYRDWIPHHSSPMEPALFDFAAESIKKEYCEPKKP